MNCGPAARLKLFTRPDGLRPGRGQRHIQLHSPWLPANNKSNPGHGPLTYQPKLFLISFLSFLIIIFIRKTVHKDKESTNLYRNPSQRLVFTLDEIEVLPAPSLWVTFLRPWGKLMQKGHTSHQLIAQCIFAH